jgi:FkbM family methyltransferase
LKEKIKNIIENILNRNIIVIPFNILINKSTVKVFNNVYESSPHIFQEIFTRIIKQPKFDFHYQIKILNGNNVNVFVDKNYKPSFEFALSYKWHDIGLRNIEKILNDYYPNSDYYLDIGSNHGLRSLYSLSISRPTILFEPNLNLNQFVIKLIATNNFDNCKIENLCLSDKKGNSKFYISGSSYLSSLDIEHAKSDTLETGIEEIEVSLLSLDDYYSQFLVDKKVSILKIDVEGHEYEVIKGGFDLLKKQSPSILIEILPESKHKDKLLNLLKNLGYRSFGIINKDGLKINEVSKINHRFNNYFFAQDDELLKKLNVVNQS